MRVERVCGHKTANSSLLQPEVKIALLASNKIDLLEAQLAASFQENEHKIKELAITSSELRGLREASQAEAARRHGSFKLENKANILKKAKQPFQISNFGSIRFNLSNLYLFTLQILRIVFDTFTLLFV